MPSGDPGDAAGRSATGRSRRSPCGRNTTTRIGRALIGFSYGSEPEEHRRWAPRQAAPGAPMWLVTRKTVHVFAHIFESEAAQAGLRHRRHQRRRPPDDSTRPGTGPAPAGPGQPLARPDQPASDPAARRRPHLLEPGREAPGQAGLPAGDGAGQRDRLRASSWSCCSSGSATTSAASAAKASTCADGGLGRRELRQRRSGGGDPAVAASTRRSCATVERLGDDVALRSGERTHHLDRALGAGRAGSPGGSPRSAWRRATRSP